MATYIDRLYSNGGAESDPGPDSFARGRRSLPMQKSRARRRLRPWHILGLLVLQAAFFLGVREAYLFVIDWEELNIKTVDVHCGKASVKTALEQYFASARPGNILLVDLGVIRDRVNRLGWVKDVRVQKVLPSTLRLDVVEREPFALLSFAGLKLVDRDGVAMEPVFSPDEYPLTVISDEGKFIENFRDKWQAARTCLESLPAGEKQRLAEIRCSDYGTLSLMFRDDPTRIVVSAARPAADLAFYRQREAEWKKDYGPLEYADTSSLARVYVKAAPPAPEGTEGTEGTDGKKGPEEQASTKETE